MALPCASQAATALVPPGPAPFVEEADQGGDVAEFIALMNGDLARATDRSVAALRPIPEVAANDPSCPAPADTLLEPDSIRPASLLIPVYGVSPDDLVDSFGNPRDGGRRRHRGIDIFAPKGTKVLAVTSGTIRYIGKQPKGGLCLWLESDDESSTSFFYAHLERWAPGLFEGMTVRQGEVLGYVGKTGNARRSNPHLHFTVIKDEKALNPYDVLRERGITASDETTSTLLAGTFEAGDHAGGGSR